MSVILKVQTIMNFILSQVIKCCAVAFFPPYIKNRYYGDILRGLYPLFGDSEPDDAVRDNAAGAVARMIMVNPQSIPLNQVSFNFIFLNL